VDLLGQDASGILELDSLVATLGDRLHHGKLEDDFSIMKVIF
jgi:hypothetical protein